MREAAESAGGGAKQGADCLQPPPPSVPRQPRKPGELILAPGEMPSRTLTEHARQRPARVWAERGEAPESSQAPTELAAAEQGDAVALAQNPGT